MKKVIALLLLLAGISQMSHADESGRVRLSSFTQTNDTACIQATYISKVLVGASSGAGSTIKLYNSTFTTTSVPLISSISLNTVNHYDFDSAQVKGICYITNLNSAGVNIIYSK